MSTSASRCEAARKLGVTVDLDAVLRCACEAAQAAGRVLAPRLGRVGRVKEKTSGPVTDCDIEAEEAALAVIRRTFPGHASLSEEEGSRGGGPFRWIVDPLDGTTNFVHGVPWYDVSIAFESQGIVDVGVVSAPTLGLLFTGVRGRGAHLNGHRIQVSQARILAGSFIDVGFRRDDWVDPTTMSRLSHLARAGTDIRSLNACALDLAFVAAGWLDGYWDMYTSVWDVAAGTLLVAEAGGRVTLQPHPDAKNGGSVIVASNPHIHRLLCNVLQMR